MRHSAKEWFGVTRYWSFPVSSMPVIVTTVFLLWKGFSLSWAAAVLACLGMVVFHAAGNILSDWWDYKKGVDTEKAYAVPNLVFHHFEPKEYMTFSIILFALGIVIGLVLTAMAGVKLLIIGGIGFILAASYSFFKYNSLGDIFVFTCFGFLPVIGTSFVATGEIDWTAVAITLPLGLFTIAVLHNNNTVDIKTDSEAGIHTIPMVLGEKASAYLYVVYMILPFACVIGAIVLGFLPWTSLTCLLAAPVALKNAQAAAGYFSKGREALLGLDQKTAQLHMMFSLLLALGLLIAYFAKI